MSAVSDLLRCSCPLPPPLPLLLERCHALLRSGGRGAELLHLSHAARELRPQLLLLVVEPAGLRHMLVLQLLRHFRVPPHGELAVCTGGHVKWRAAAARARSRAVASALGAAVVVAASVAPTPSACCTILAPSSDTV
jgi:hypothetical protein